MPNSYEYDRGDHRRKHCWNQSHADFQSVGQHLVGKCPKHLTDKAAEAILNEAIPEPDPFELSGDTKQKYPKRLYAVHDGVIYEAAVTTPGRSYHGYPWRARPGRGKLDEGVLKQLREHAKRKGCLEEMEDWLDQYG